MRVQRCYEPKPRRKGRGDVQIQRCACYFLSFLEIAVNIDMAVKGSAIYVNSGLDDISPIFTVNLDGQSTDVDGVRSSRAFTCDILFSKTGLDPTVEHTIALTVKGPSPNRNMTTDPEGTSLVFSVIDFMSVFHATSV